MTPEDVVANPIQAISDRFSNLVRDRLTISQLNSINLLNNAPGHAGVCATIRFIDSDSLMREAFALATGCFYSPDRNADQSLWNAGWALSKVCGFVRRMRLILVPDGGRKFVYLIHGQPVFDLRRDNTGEIEVQPHAYYQLLDDEIAAIEHANAFLYEDRERKSINAERIHSARTGWSPIETLLYDALKCCVLRSPDIADSTTRAAITAYETQLDAAARVSNLQARNRSASALLVDAVNATGGLVCDGPGVFFPKADSQWLDLSDAYLAACCERRVEPMISTESFIDTDTQEPHEPQDQEARSSISPTGERNAPKFADVHVKLTGEDGNVFAIMSRVEDALRKAGATDDQLKGFRVEIEAGDYDDALRTVMRWVRVS